MVIFALTAGVIATIVTATNFTPVRASASGEPTMIWMFGAAIFALGYGVMLWCSVVNPFLETTVRIQDDNQHQVIESGPYACVRHPMYVGLIAVFLATPFMIGSSWLFIPLTWCVAVLTFRTALEDRTLQAELPGYAQYAERVRFRLLPGVW